MNLMWILLAIAPSGEPIEVARFDNERSCRYALTTLDERNARRGIDNVRLQCRNALVVEAAQ